jgi:sarcosine oxidase, subunit gamma
MSEVVSALGGASYQGFATITEIGPLGMITLRCKHDEPALAGALAALTLDLPAQRRVEQGRDRACAWMSPDEVLVILPYPEVAQALEVLGAKLAGVHHLAVDVSDARAVFEISGSQARDVLAKLSPVDLAPGHFGPGEIRRSRIAQVAGAFWMVDDTTFRLVCFRSVARYVFDLLAVSARPGSEPGLFAR